MSPLNWLNNQRGVTKISLSFAIPIGTLALGFGVRGLLNNVPRHYEDRNCLDVVDAPIAVLLDNTLVKATAHPFGPGWIIIPMPPLPPIKLP